MSGAGGGDAGDALDAQAAADVLQTLRQPATIRSRCNAILQAAERGQSQHFRIDNSRLPAVAERVAALTLRRFPDLRIPFHSRWRHFEAGGVDRKPVLDALLAHRSQADAARARFDLTVVSVLLDAGAGPDWRYQEAGTGLSLARSEGLGVASWHAFLAGMFSADAQGDPLRADAAALQRIDATALRNVFQAGDSNPIVGLTGRAGLLARLGGALVGAASSHEAPRPALMFDRLTAGGTRTAVTASQVLAQVLQVLGPIWTSGSRLGSSANGVLAGDVWPHRAAGGHGPSAGWVPFHKLSQWLSYSLLEPLQWAGVQVTGLDALTGLPEYRNGGLLLDAGVLLPIDPHALSRTHKPQDDVIVEWRALTVALLDVVAQQVRQRLQVTQDQLPLACVLEGGTWAAGREIAAELRPGGAPPLRIDSDGTIF